MRLFEFGLLVIILLLLACIVILCVVCSMKLYKLLYGSYEKEHELPVRISRLQGPFNQTIDPRTIQTRIKFLRKPYKRMKEMHARNMPPIVEVSTPADSDAAVTEFDLDESNEKVSICPQKNGGVTNYWKKDSTIIVM